jgi:hypothetical protein
MKKRSTARARKLKRKGKKRRNAGVYEKWVIGPIPDDFELSLEEEKEFLASGPHTYDKAKWHYEGDYPKSLNWKQAFVHTGMFVGWLHDHGMVTDEFLAMGSVGRRFKQRQITGAQVYEIWGGCLLSDQLTEQGNEFAHFYYKGKFGDDYQALLVGSLPSFYHVKDTWQNYETIKRRIDERYAAWKKKRGSRKRKRS